MSQENSLREVHNAGSYFGLVEGAVSDCNNAVPTNNAESCSQVSQPEHDQLESVKLPDVPIAELMRDVGQQFKLVQANWAKTFSESENFEEFCPQRCEKLVKEAKILEENLRKHKENVKQRLQHLTTTLQTS